MARHLGVSESRLHEWKKAVREKGAAAFPGSGKSRPDGPSVRVFFGLKKASAGDGLLKNRLAFLDSSDVSIRESVRKVVGILVAEKPQTRMTRKPWPRTGRAVTLS